MTRSCGGAARLRNSITPTHCVRPRIMRPFGVYSGYFTDPDGHLFEIAWNSNE
jgi:catechol 2,3-dioxygenase-like lactoylglutathione lyase family enzyme